MKNDVNSNNRKNIEGENYEEVAQANNVPSKDCGKENGEIVTFDVSDSSNFANFWRSLSACLAATNSSQCLFMS